ncbi:transcriptional regulator BolA [Candidatus Gullanella endobia]|uniref:Transcriptional regulator BolA n=1 Tax=Candidatus Gullanella endobia TaxID=1070130 RepID=A0A143WR94_9ENTR|nr:BolA family protein [Candidatus Gullanella endobia]CUX96252.1 transcriptional regulator BolA [Candidatus Gullanella endobia]
MEINEIKSVLMQALLLDEVYVIKNGKNFQIIAISDQFSKISLIKKHKIIYTPLIEYILDNRIHALSIKAYTKNEWKRNCKMNDFKCLP